MYLPRLLSAFFMCLQTLYFPPQPQHPPRSRFMLEFIAPTCPFAPTLFYCLFNCAVSYDPLGYGIPYAR